MAVKIENFTKYGIDSDLANKLISLNLTVSKCRTLSKKDLTETYKLNSNEVDLIKLAIVRQPIEPEVIELLLENSNFLCNICKGDKGHSYIIHHIEEYENSQDNNYNNLIVLCPNDHDLAHKKGRGLTNSISKEQLLKSKFKWEKEVEKANFEKAHKNININQEAIDFINIPRLEELALRLYKKIPETSCSHSLHRKKILDDDNSFDIKYVSENISNGRYLFDYMNSGESLHYHELLKIISNKIEFKNIENFLKVNSIKKGLLDNQYVYFSGGVYSKSPQLPITNSSEAIIMHYKKGKFRLEWILDPMYMFSMSAICRIGGKNTYAIYGVVRNINYENDIWNISIRPFIVAQPTTRLHRKPEIAYKKEYEKYMLESNQSFTFDMGV